MQLKKISRALISVSDKTGILELAKALRDNGVEIIASDGTAAYLQDNKIDVRTVTEITGSPEILGGKVKTLHPAIHAAILANPDDSLERSQLTAIGPIDALIINLYQLPGFDIGGPAMIRAGAKNYEHVCVITSPTQYSDLAMNLKSGISLSQRQQWARTALITTAEYDLQLAAQSGTSLRYGENPHQSATLVSKSNLGVAGSEFIQGKAMSFNNFLDIDAAWKLCNVIKGSVSIVKHGIPTGVAHSRDLAAAYRSAFACDSISAFGGVVAVSAHVDEMCALEITKNFTEVVAAPSYTEAALILFSSKSNLRVIKIKESQPTPWEFRAIDGGYLIQERDLFTENDSATSWKLVAGKACNSSQLKDLEFAWRIAALSRSNAIVVAKDQATVGIGAGNVNRLDAARSAVFRAQPHSLQGSVAASDAFFPFPDALEILIASGVSAVVQPGGSVNDFDVIAAAQAAGITMYTSGIRHFSH